MPEREGPRRGPRADQGRLRISRARDTLAISEWRERARTMDDVHRAQLEAEFDFIAAWNAEADRRAMIMAERDARRMERVMGALP